VRLRPVGGGAAPGVSGCLEAPFCAGNPGGTDFSRRCASPPIRGRRGPRRSPAPGSRPTLNAVEGCSSGVQGRSVAAVQRMRRSKPVCCRRVILSFHLVISVRTRWNIYDNAQAWPFEGDDRFPSWNALRCCGIERDSCLSQTYPRRMP